MESSSIDDARALSRLELEERTVSSKRGRVHDRLAFMRSGAAVPSADHDEQLRKLEDEERELSARRRELHEQIDALRSKLGQQPGARPRPRQLGG